MKKSEFNRSKVVTEQKFHLASSVELGKIIEFCKDITLLLERTAWMFTHSSRVSLNKWECGAFTEPEFTTPATDDGHWEAFTWIANLLVQIILYQV